MDKFVATYLPRLLQISNDASLASSRSLLLQYAGWQTEVCNTQALTPSSLLGYDLLLFCQSIPSQLVAGIVHTIATTSARGMPLLRIAWGNDATFDASYQTLLAPVSPRELIESAGEALSRMRARYDRKPNYGPAISSPAVMSATSA